jgi:predicted CopG family antitoxin
MSETKLERKTISVSVETYRRLSKLGNFGDSMNDVIERLLDNEVNR